MTARRELLVVVLLDVVGAVLVLVTTSQPWAHAVVSLPDSPVAPVRVDLSGRSVAPVVAALGLAALAAVVALLATRGIARVFIGALIAVIDTSEMELQKRSVDLAEHFFDERPRDFGNRLSGWLQQWIRGKAPNVADALVCKGDVLGLAIPKRR